MSEERLVIHHVHKIVKFSVCDEKWIYVDLICVWGNHSQVHNVKTGIFANCSHRTSNIAVIRVKVFYFPDWHPSNIDSVLKS